MSFSPFFLTGANAKIKLNGKTMAFCTDVSYSIDIIHQTPKVLGMYEGSSIEPLGYSVSGSFTVIRYAKDAAKAIGNHPNGTTANDAGNGVGNWGGVWGGKTGDILARNGIGNDGRANEALDPSKFFNGTSFDIEIYQKTASHPVGIGRRKPNQNSVFGADVFSETGKAAERAALDARRNASAAILGASGQSDQIGIAKIRNVRITRADFSLSKKGVAVQRFSFSALYVDEDSFVADYSGRGQHF
jgi:hypothetical protein